MSRNTVSAVCARVRLTLLAMSFLSHQARADYGVNTCEEYGIKCLAGRGLIEDSALGLTEVVWVGPENRMVYVGSPSIWKTANGSCLASHDFFGHTTVNNSVQVFVDHSGHCEGESAEWTYQGNVSGMYWVNMFVPPKQQGNYVFLLGVSSGDASTARSIVISKSDDYGRSWTSPTVLFPADPSTKTTYHCAPTPVLVASDGRLYRAFEVFGNVGAVLIRTVKPVTSDTDILSPESWEISGHLGFNKTSMLPPGWNHSTPFGWQEGNAVEGPDGIVYDILRIDGQDSQTYNKAAVVKLDTTNPIDGTFGTLVFEKMIDFPSTSSKFTIRRSTDSKYYTLSTDVTGQAVRQNTVWARNHLVIAVSDNLLDNWTICATLLTDDTGMNSIDSAHYTGFHYVDWVFDGNDIIYAIRTGYRGANSFHNANRLSIKRVTNYSAICAPWSLLDVFRPVGNGWCRPTSGWVPGGQNITLMDCATQCRLSDSCEGFANGVNPGGSTSSCALYRELPNASSNTPGFECYGKKN